MGGGRRFTLIGGSGGGTTIRKLLRLWIDGDLKPRKGWNTLVTAYITGVVKTVRYFRIICVVGMIKNNVARPRVVGVEVHAFESRRRHRQLATVVCKFITFLLRMSTYSGFILSRSLLLFISLYSKALTIPWARSLNNFYS